MLHRIPTNYAVAAGIALAVAAWMATGLLRGDVESGGGDTGRADGAGGAFAVEVKTSEAQPVTRRIVAQGEVVPERSALLRAQTAGQVEAVLVEPGQAVAAGEVLVRLAMDDRRARLREAEARLAQREAEFEAAERLEATGFQARLQREQARTALEAARAAVERIRLEIRHTEIRAPFDAVVDELQVDVGDYATQAQPVASVVDNDPLTAVAYLSQQHFDAVRTGASARVTLISGERVEGRLTAVAPRAEAASRTFRVEVEVANPGGVPTNTSAEIEIPVNAVDAHRLSPALLVLDDDGELGVKTVGPDGRVDFRLVEIVRSDAGGVWVAGLPRRARIITVGSGFVAQGERVEAVEREAPEPAGASPG
jgi:multidrug efflux system membrane fusion protein